MSQIFIDITAKKPNIKAANLIAGGVGETEFGKYINVELFKGTNTSAVNAIDPNQPVLYGDKVAFITFCAPGPLHLHGANRNRQDVATQSLDHTNKLNSIVWTREALQQLDADKQAVKIITQTSLGLNSTATSTADPSSAQNSNNSTPLVYSPPTSQLK